MKVSGGGRGSCRGEVAKKGKRRKQRMEGRVERGQEAVVVCSSGGQ